MLACCGLCSCNDLIDIYPVENNVADKFYSSEFEINQAVMGVYARFICRHRDICAVSVCHLWDETKKLRTAEHQKDS